MWDSVRHVRDLVVEVGQLKPRRRVRGPTLAWRVLNGCVLTLPGLFQLRLASSSFFFIFFFKKKIISEKKKKLCPAFYVLLNND
jgi:hypothetical protein